MPKRKKAAPLKTRAARTENTVPWFWPFEFAAAVGEDELSLFKRGLETMAEAEKLEYGLTPKFATPNKIVLELHTLRLRDFTVDQAGERRRRPSLTRRLPDTRR